MHLRGGRARSRLQNLTGEVVFKTARARRPWPHGVVALLLFATLFLHPLFATPGVLFGVRVHGGDAVPG